MKDLGRVTFPPASTSGGGSPVTPPRVSLRRIQWRVIEHTVRLAPEAAGGRGRGCAGATPAPGRTARRWGRRGAGCRERSTGRARRRSRGGVLAAAQLCEGGLGLWVRAPNRASATSVHTVPLAKPATRLGFRLPSAQVVEAHHTVRPRPPLRSPAAASCARAGDSVRGVDMCRSCIDEGDGNTADTGLSRWRAAGRTHCASAQGARRTQSGPPNLKHSE